MPEISLDGVRIELSSRKAAALLAYLACDRPRCSRDELVTLLWPEKSQERGRAVLRRVFHTLARSGLREYVRAGRDTVTLATGRVRTDVAEFLACIDETTHHDHTAAETCPDCYAPLSRAAVLYSSPIPGGIRRQGQRELRRLAFL
jgi:DNA-binding SARP family transcriptional activator